MDKHTLAYSFVCRMFVTEPDSVKVFRFLNVDDPAKWTPNEKLLLKNSVMKKHLTLVVRFIDVAVQLLDDEAAITEKAELLGVGHVTYEANVHYLKVTTPPT